MEKNIDNEIVEIYRLRNYRGHRAHYCLQLPAGYDETKAEKLPYILPKGWSKLMEGDKCLAIRTSGGELVKFFLVKSISEPGICLADGSLHFLKRAKSGSVK